MDSVRLGRTGLRISKVVLGCMSFGTAERGAHGWTLDEESSRPLIRQALEAGITTFDTADVYSDGTSEEYGGLFVATTLRQSAPFAEQLGLALLPSGCVQVDAMGRTSVPGVHAAGDMAHVPELAMPMASVLTAAASGLVAGAAMAAYLL